MPDLVRMTFDPAVRKLPGPAMLWCFNELNNVNQDNSSLARALVICVMSPHFINILIRYNILSDMEKESSRLYQRFPHSSLFSTHPFCVFKHHLSGVSCL